MIRKFLRSLTPRQAQWLSAGLALNTAAVIAHILFSDVCGNGFAYILPGAIFEGMIEVILPVGAAVAIAKVVPFILLALCLHRFVDSWVQKFRGRSA